MLNDARERTVSFLPAAQYRLAQPAIPVFPAAIQNQPFALGHLDEPGPPGRCSACNLVGSHDSINLQVINLHFVFVGLGIQIQNNLINVGIPLGHLGTVFATKQPDFFLQFSWQVFCLGLERKRFPTACLPIGWAG